MSYAQFLHPSTLQVDREGREILRYVFNHLQEKGGYPPIKPLRVQFEPQRRTIDRLTRDRFLSMRDGRYELNLRGLIACDSPESRLELDDLNSLIEALKELYRKRDSPTIAANEIARSVGREPDEIARRLIILDDLFFPWTSMRSDVTGLVTSLTLSDLILDVQPFANLGSLPTPSKSTTVTTPYANASPEKDSPRLDVFVSHSHLDKPLADALVDLLLGSLEVAPDRIRCTSTSGLPGGANIDHTLQREIREAPVCIGLITAAANGSAYVLFELGGRWANGQYTIPLLAGGATPELLPGPLKQHHALSCQSATDLHALVRDVAKAIEVSRRDPATYQNKIDALMAASHRAATAVITTRSFTGSALELQATHDDTWGEPTNIFTYKNVNGNIEFLGSSIRFVGSMDMARAGEATVRVGVQGEGPLQGEYAFLLYTATDQTTGQYFRGVMVLRLPTFGPTTGYWLTQHSINAGQYVLGSVQLTLR